MELSHVILDCIGYFAIGYMVSDLWDLWSKRKKAKQ